MKKFFSILLAALLCLSVSACAGGTEPSAQSSGSVSPSGSPSSEGTSPEQPESTPAVDMDPGDRLMGEYVTDGGPFSGRLPDTETPQLICKDETARRLALAVKPLLERGVHNLSFFDSDHPVDPDIALEIAVLNTKRTDFGEGSYSAEEGYRSEKYPDHPITKRLDQLWKDGESPTDVFYADDVAATLERLFGITNWTHQSVDWLLYFPEEGVYIMNGMWTGRGYYPQLLSWEETENGYTCEVFLTDGFFGTVNDVVVTEENIQEVTAREAHYTFTFDTTTGEPVATAFAQTKAGLASEAERLVDDYLLYFDPEA